jgi:hypothetical protein
MDVTGRNCRVLQQAVTIDPDDQRLVVLGNVRRSIVVTPDLALE